MKKCCVICGGEFLALPPRSVPFYDGDEPKVRSTHALTCSHECWRDKKIEEDRQRHLADPDKYIVRARAWYKRNTERAKATAAKRRMEEKAARRAVRLLGIEI